MSEENKHFFNALLGLFTSLEVQYFERSASPLVEKKNAWCLRGQTRGRGGEGREGLPPDASTGLTLRERPMKLLFGFGDISMTAIAGLVLLHA